jgi:hypothetical protein
MKIGIGKEVEENEGLRRINKGTGRNKVKNLENLKKVRDE